MSILKDTLSSHPNFIVTKPGCSYCTLTRRLLKAKNIPFKEYSVENNKELSKSIKATQRYFNYPMIFIDKKFIRGFFGLGEKMKLPDSRARK